MLKIHWDDVLDLTINDLESWKDSVDKFIELHGTNLDGAKFKIGEEVRVKGKNKIVKILAINYVGWSFGGYEYLLSDYSFLLYEQELERAY